MKTSPEDGNNLFMRPNAFSQFFLLHTFGEQTKYANMATVLPIATSVRTISVVRTITGKFDAKCAERDDGNTRP